MTNREQSLKKEKQYETSLRELCEKRAKKIYGDYIPTRIRDRVNTEMLFIHKKNMAGTFLELADLLQTVCFTGNNNYEKGFRGALGASLVAFLCGITPFNPMEIRGMEFYPEVLFGASFPRFASDSPIPIYMNLSGSLWEKIEKNSAFKESDSCRKYFFYETENLSLLEKLHQATGDIYKTEILTGDMQIHSSFFEKIMDPVDQQLGYRLPELESNAIVKSILKKERADFEVLVKCIGLSHGQGTWHHNGEYYKELGIDIRETIACAEDVYEYMLRHGCEKNRAFQIMETVRNGKTTLSEEDIQFMKDLKIPLWFVDSCREIKYLFYRPQLVCYALEYERLAYYCCEHHRKYRKVTISSGIC